ncbi:MAG: hypothetical protein DI538_27145 [Azospira oryzae]|jgi:hypothetical protein|nr:MAG: hypothetical protein DI538_27145 [Azospira oryzae]
MLRLLILFSLFIFSLSTAHAQQNPVLDKNISFAALSKKKAERTVSWTNPDGSSETLNLIEMAIPVNEKLTTEFNKNNYGIASPWLTPKMIVLHSMDLGSLKESLEQSSLLHDRIPESWGLLSKAGKLPNGAHFMVDKDGTIYCLTPPMARNKKKVDYTSPAHRWYVKRHQDGNPCAIGIENVTDANGDYTDLTAEQVEANSKLVRWLIQFEENRIEYVNSHHQFNDENTLNHLHKLLELNYQNKPFRTTGRKDIGDDKLTDILLQVKLSGYTISSF